MLNEVFDKNASSQGRFVPVFLPMLRGVHVNVVIRRPGSDYVAHKSHINLASAAANSCTEGERRDAIVNVTKSTSCVSVTNLLCHYKQDVSLLTVRRCWQFSVSLSTD